jgi:CO dehydrogenase maturation factor
MGTVRGGGLGCTCPENTFLKALLGHLLVERKEVVILDMEAGIEHLGRGTVKAVDLLIIVVEPTFLSIQTALRINKLASDIGIKRVGIIGNKIQQEAEKKFIIENLKRFEILGFISYDEKIKQVTITNKLLEEGKKILDCIIERI